MDIDKRNFYPLLLDILTDISEAHFVAFDLELSGVPSKDALAASSGKATLQQRYLETKEAAERYQILQIGLTCVEQDVSGDRYVLKPYNFDLSPIISERLDVERIFSFQSGAAEFLLRNGFNMNKPFQDGVPYLSRAESKLARQKHAKRQDKSAVAEIQIKPTETESIAFLQRVRDEIDAWVQSRKRDTPEYLNINSVAADVARAMFEKDEFPAELSRFEKRLVHQLVRAEYPELVTISKRGFIQIIKFDKEREDKIAAGRQRDLEERISRQKGFRWVIDALRGSNIDGIDLREVAKDTVTGEPIVIDLSAMKHQLHRAQELMRHNPRVLVGHNCFLDLIYIFHTFIGPLPETVEEFQSKLHEHFPVIVDNKYMSTHECGDINPVSSLEQIAHQLSSEVKPKVVTDPDHDKYDNVEAFHEAGYDSFLTAQVAVRLSSKLRRDNKDTLKATVDLSSLTLNGNGKDKVTKNAKQQPTNGFTPSNPGDKWERVGDPTIGASPEGSHFKYDPTDTQHRHKRQEVTLPSGDGMPVFGSEFWRIYGNKLRVFGTQEGVCSLENQSDVKIEVEPETDDGGGVRI